MYDVIFVDLTDFTAAPIRTGVQRVTANIIDNSRRINLIPFRVHSSTQVDILDRAILGLLSKFFFGAEKMSRKTKVGSSDKLDHIERLEFLIKFIGSHPVARIPAVRFFQYAAKIVNLESFTDVNRSRFYASCPLHLRHKVSHLVHDLLLFESPDMFPQLNWRYAHDYVELFAAYENAGSFIVATEGLKEKLVHYFGRNPGDIRVVHFGGNIGKTANDSLNPERRRVVVLGTLEPRKMPLAVFSALHRVGISDQNIECIVVGKWGWVDLSTRTKIEEILDQGVVQHKATLADAELLDLMAGASVGVYVSHKEGFGLPVIEFAYLGVPVVTNSSVPASELVGIGATVLADVSVEAIVEAIRRALDHDDGVGQYYSWTWHDCASEIFLGESSSSDRQRAAMEAWKALPGLHRNLRSRGLSWEELKVELRSAINMSMPESGMRLAALCLPPNDEQGEAFERLAEVTSDNLNFVFWADIIAIKPYIDSFVDVCAADQSLESISRAFMIFLGRPIDARAAAEALRLTSARARIDRVRDLVFCQEASVNLGEQCSFALRKVVEAAVPLVHAAFDAGVDSFEIHHLLGIKQPSLAEVQRLENIGGLAVERLRLLIDLAQYRPVYGDDVDYFLEAVAEHLSRQRDSKGTNRQQPNPKTVRSQTVVSVASSLFREGWYHLENGGDQEFRWMGTFGVIGNPEPAMMLERILLKVCGVYGAHAPSLQSFVGNKMLHIRVEEDLNSDGWIAAIEDTTGPFKAHMIRVVADRTDRPSDVEGTLDSRDLSVRVSEVVFEYA